MTTLDNTVPLSVPTAQEDNRVPLPTPAPNRSALPYEQAVNRAGKIAYALQGTAAEQPSEDLVSAVATGNEDQVREQATNALYSDLANKRSDAIAAALINKQGPLSQEDIIAINKAYGYDKSFDPTNVVEFQYGRKAINELDNYGAQLDDSSFWKQAKAKIKDDQDAAKAFGSITTAQHAYLTNKAQELQTQIEQQSSWGYGADIAKLMFPLFNPYYEIKMRGNIPGTNFLTGGLLGSNLEEQRVKLLQMPFPQFTKTLDEVTTNLSKDNPSAALMFVQQMMGQTTSDRILNDVNTLGHVAEVAGIAGAGYRLTNTALKNMSRTAVRDVVEASTTPSVTQAEPVIAQANIKASAGNVPEAAVDKAVVVANTVRKGSTNPTDTALETVPRFLRSDREFIKADPGDLTTTQVNAILEQYDALEKNVMGALKDVVRPMRVPLSEASPEVMRAIQLSTFDRYPGPSNAIIRMTDPVLEPISNTYHMTAWIGKRAGEFFRSYGEAVGYATFHGFPKESVKPRNQQGLGFYIELQGKLKETDKVVRDFIYQPTRTSSKSVDSATKYFPWVNHIRTAEDTVSPEQRLNRKPAVYGQSVFKDIAKEEGKYISSVERGGGLRKEQWEQFRRTLDHARRAIDPDTGKPGYFFKTPSELQQFYLANFDRPPTFNETQGYFANKRLVELDRILREVSLYRNKARVGADTHEIISKRQTITYKKPPEMSAEDQAAIAAFEGEGGAPGREFPATPQIDSVKMEEVRSPAFDGVRRRNLKATEVPVLLIGEDVHTSRVFTPTPKERAVLDKEVLKGNLKLIEVYDAETRPFKDFVADGDKRIQYVLAPNVETKPLQWTQLNRTGGGHFDFEYDNYIKQAKMSHETIEGVKHSIYEGDRTVAPVEYKAMGEDVVKEMNHLRTLLRDEKMDEANTYAAANAHKLPFDWSEFKRNFYPKKDENGKILPPTHDLHEPFVVVPRGASISQLSNDLKSRYASSWRDGTKEGLARNFQVQYTGERDVTDLFTFENKGTRQNPVYNIKPAELVDPIRTTNRAMNRIINTFFMDDYKTSAIEALLQEAQPLLKAEKGEIAASPFAHFVTMDRSSFLAQAPRAEVNKIMANKFKIDQLIGTPSYTDGLLYDIAQKLYDAHYNMPQGIGEKLKHPVRTTAGALGYMTPEWILPKLKDPFAYIRGITFNIYLGLGYLPQLLVQQATYANIWAITPRHAVVGTMAAYLNQASRFTRNEGILNHLDNIATKMRIPGLPKYAPGEWLEATRELNKTGFQHVGGEQSMLANMHKGIITRKGENLLNAFQFAFREGEKNVRLGAWYVAMKEFRTAKPTGAITEADRLKILDRADFLYGNMSNASNSALNSGIVSLPTQFYLYTTRMGELMWSKRIGETRAERVLTRSRIVALNSVLFGVPMGLASSGLPVSEWLRKTAIENGYTPGKNLWASLGMEGVVAQSLAWATGEYYNVGQRYGLQGMERIRQVMMEDATFWEIIGGASYSWISRSGDNFGGLIEFGRHAVRGEWDKFPLKVEDFVDIFKEIQTVNAGWALWVAINTGKWINKRGQPMHDVSKAEALGMFLTGVRRTSQSDDYYKKLVLKDLHDYQREAEKRFTTEMSRSFLAFKNGDTEGAQQFRNKAVQWLVSADMPSERIAGALSKAVKENSDVIKRTNFELYYRNAPASQRKVYQDTYRYILQNEGK